MKLFVTILFGLILTPLSQVACQQNAQKDIPWSVRVADSFLQRHPGGVTYDSGSPSTKWNYEQGLMLIALHRMYERSGAEQYVEFVNKNLDGYIGANGSISMYSREDYNLDNIAPGRAVLYMYQRTHDEKFRAAADTLYRQLKEQPRTKEGGFWHKKIYPNQMWLDGLFMAEPFYAMYATLFKKPEIFNDIANQFGWLAKHTRDAKTGLFYHGWDESKEQRWADSVTGCSPTLWSRSMGWYGMGLVDVLDYFPVDHPRRKELLLQLQEFAAAVVRYQDGESHLWYQVMNAGTREGNYLESSASAMFAYILAKGVHKGYLDNKYLVPARSAFDGLIQLKLVVNDSGMVDLFGTCKSAGLGGSPYRDGSFDYYVREPRRTNDLKGLGAFLFAAIELEGEEPAVTKVKE